MRTRNQELIFLPIGKGLLTALFLLGISTTTRADITGASMTDGSGGAFTVLPSTFSGGSLSVSAWQYWAGDLTGTITTDTPSDPTLSTSQSINNDGASPWVGYQVAIAMNSPFSFAPSSVSVANPPNNDWVVSSIIAPSIQASGPFAGAYEGFLDFSDGTPVAVGQELDFNYALTFGGASSYSFTEILTPNVPVVPEPDQFTLMTVTGLVLGGFRIIKRMRKA
jgi:hypothetical protein